jgi:two-component system chemotaxis sensor kinase CheA
VKKDIQAQEQVDTAKEKKTSKPISKTVKIDLEEIDNMMDIVGEMLVIKNSLPYIAQDLNNSNVELSKRDLLARYDEINRVTTQLQEKVMHMRLLSLSFIFDRYPKLVRDISKSLDKKIKYREEGGDTKLDKTIIEKLADPLIHIIRNSLDHGIERKEERKLKGKDPQGQISIKAESLGDKVYITIQDDGKGIDLDRVVEKSLEKKMVTKEELEDMSEQQKLMLVFHPGVSTMEQISELSGRGVGMDVVRQTIDEVGGKISLNSEIDKGTKITLELPMSVALSNVFHVKLGNANYALSMDCISETVRVRNKDVEYINRKPMLKLRGDLIPLIFYYELLSKDIDNKGSYSLLIVQTQGAKFGFVVDEFVNQLDIVQKPLSSNFKNHPFISGTSLLGNGEVLFVINPVKLINLKEK